MLLTNVPYGTVKSVMILKIEIENENY